jgi:hypothetical protein
MVSPFIAVLNSCKLSLRFALAEFLLQGENDAETQSETRWEHQGV